MQRGEVLVVGSVNCDITVRVPRLPRPAETVLGLGPAISVGGKGFNQAAAAHALGAATRFVGAAGSDAFGERIVAHLADVGLTRDGLAIVKDRPSGIAVITVDADGTNAIAVAPGANACVGVDQVREALGAARPAVLLVQLEIPVQVVAASLETARAHGVTTILNPAPADPAILCHLPLVDILTPNEHELAELTGVPLVDVLAGGALFERAAAMLQARSGGTILVTRGEKGCAAFDGQSAVYLPAFAVTPIDTTGAGDVFNGALAAAIATGTGLADAMRQASAAAAISTTRASAQGSAPDAAAVRALIDMAASQ